MEKVRASHLLVKHQESRRPASWRDPEGKEILKRSKEQAIGEVEQFRSDIASGKVEFGELAKKYSDCSSAKRGGDLGWFGRGQMQKSFEEAAFALNVGEMSGTVDSDSGVHIILRTG